MIYLLLACSFEINAGYKNAPPHPSWIWRTVEVHFCEIWGGGLSADLSCIHRSGRACNVISLPAITEIREIGKSTDTHSLGAARGWVVSEPLHRNKELY